MGNPENALTISTKDSKDPTDEENPIDLSQLPSIPLAKSLVLINNYASNTTRFLNHFAYECEQRLHKVGTNLTRVEILLALLEAKLNSIPDLVVAEPLNVESTIGMKSEDLPAADGHQIATIGRDEEVNNGESIPRLAATPLFTTDPEHMESEQALMVADGGEGGAEMQESATLKLKDNPAYAKYFTMRRLGMPEGAIRQKMAIDGVDASVLGMDPDMPITSVIDETPQSRALPHVPPPMSTIGSDSESDDGFVVPDSRIPQYLPSSPSNSITSSTIPPPPLSAQQKESNIKADHRIPLFRDSFGSSPRHSFMSDEFSDDGTEPQKVSSQNMGPTGVLKLRDDPEFSKYFTMQKMGLPEGAIRQKMMMDGVQLDILSMDPDGPSPNGGVSNPDFNLAPSSTQMPSHSQLPPPPTSRHQNSGSDDSFVSN